MNNEVENAKMAKMLWEQQEELNRKRAMKSVENVEDPLVSPGIMDFNETTGKGQGVGGPKQGTGGTDTCVCPECGATAKHERGTPCTDMKCPKCGTKMVGEGQAK